MRSNCATARWKMGISAGSNWPVELPVMTCSAAACDSAGLYGRRERRASYTSPIGHHPRRQRNVAARQPIGVAVAVEALVMMAGDVDGHLQERQRRAVVL